MRLLTKEQVYAFFDSIKLDKNLNKEFLFDVYEACHESALNLIKNKVLNLVFNLQPEVLLLYIIHEHSFVIQTNKISDHSVLEDDEKYVGRLVSQSLDKFFTNEGLSYESEKLANRFNPPISTISLYINFMLGMLKRYKQNSPKETLVIDILHKSLSMCKCILSLLTDGFETSAFSTWRTLHESECILKVLIDNGAPTIDLYLTHMRYGMAFRGAYPKEETDNIFVDIKAKMAEMGLKSKDMKKFIEYGWLRSVKEFTNLIDFKLNFRDGVQRLAGLNEYSKVYEMSSEIAHSSPLLIYSQKNYFFMVTLLNLYESFFRLEKIFTTIYASTVDKEEIEKYRQMRQIYYSLLVSLHMIEKNRFIESTKRK